MTASQAIGILEQMTDTIKEMASNLSESSWTVMEQWEQLGRMGAQRDDHAASLLVSLRPFVQGIHLFTDSVLKQIDGFEKNPFGDS